MNVIEAARACDTHKPEHHTRICEQCIEAAIYDLERRVEGLEIELHNAFLQQDDLESSIARLEEEKERLLLHPTTAEVSRLRSVVQERDVEQARLQRELNLRVEMLETAVERVAQAEAAADVVRHSNVEMLREIDRLELRAEQAEAREAAMREALEFYAGPSNSQARRHVIVDGGKRARGVLAALSPDAGRAIKEKEEA